MTTLRPAVFLDRDGTINVEVSYIGNPDQLVMLPGAAAAIRRLNQAGLPVVVVTNQSAIGRGYFPAAAVAAVNQRMYAELAQADAWVDAVYLCPHRPDEGCACRKPAPGLLMQAAAELNLDLTQSMIVGDRFTDLAAGAAVGCRTVLVLTGHGAEEWQQGGAPAPDYVAADLVQAVEWWLAQRQ